MEQSKCVRVVLTAKKYSDGYLIYVFRNLDTMEFIMCSQCPNWNCKEVELMQEGFLEYRFVKAGKDTYFDKVSGKHLYYNYTAHYFQDFVPITHVLKDGFVVKTDVLKVS